MSGLNGKSLLLLLLIIRKLGEKGIKSPYENNFDYSSDRKSRLIEFNF